MSDPTLVSITPDLQESLSLIHEDRSSLPEELRRTVADCLSQYAKVENEVAKEPSQPELDSMKEADVYIPYSTLMELSRWTRLPKSSRALARAGIDTNRYSMIALCAGTKTYTTAAQDRLIKTDPTVASEFLPPTFTPKPQSISTEYRSIRKEISTVLNVLFSIGGVGGAVYVVAHSSAGMRQESAILLSFLAAAVTAFAEVWLWIAYSRRSARRAQEGEALRLAEMRQAGPSDAEVKETRQEGRDDAEVKPVDMASEEKSQSDVPNDVIPSKNPEKREIRLRRRPIGETL